jgi:hypothetical protein
MVRLPVPGVCERGWWGRPSSVGAGAIRLSDIARAKAEEVRDRQTPPQHSEPDSTGYWLMRRLAARSEGRLLDLGPMKLFHLKHIGVFCLEQAEIIGP